MSDDFGDVLTRHLRQAGVSDPRLAGMARREFSDVIRQRPPSLLGVEREARRVVRQVVALGEREAKLAKRLTR